MKKYSYVLSRFFLLLLAMSVLPNVHGTPSATPLDPATNISVSLEDGGQSVIASWDYGPLPSDPGTFVLLRREVTSGPPLRTIGVVPYDTVATLAYDFTIPEIRYSVKDVGPLVDGKYYEYKVQIKTNETPPSYDSGASPTSAIILVVQFGGTPFLAENPDLKTNSTVTIVIHDDVTGEDGYNIFIRELGTETYSKVNSPTVVNASEEPRTLTGLKGNTYYEVFVQAFKSDNNIARLAAPETSVASNVVTLKTNRDLPPKPSVFKLDYLCPERAIVSFSFADYTQFDEWELRRGAEILAYGNAAPSITRDLNGLIAGAPYPLTVLTRNETGAISSEVLYFVTPVFEPPLAPINVSGPSNITQNSMTVNWQNAAEDAACYNRLRTENTIFVKIVKRDGTVENRIEATYKDATAYTVTNLPMKATVTIIVAAVGPRGTTYGAPVTGVTLGPPYAPTDAAGTAGRDALGDGEIVLTWKDNAADEDGAIIEIGTGPGTFKFLSTIDKNITKFIHKPIQSGLTYSYRIKYFNTYGDSEYSTVYTIIPSFTKEPKAPFNLNAVAGTGVINLKWQDDSNEESGFEISRSVDAGVIWTKLGTVGVNVVTFTDSDVKSGTVYWYGVRAINEVGSSDRATTKITFGTVVANMRVNVFPNPTVDAINLRIDYSGNGSVSIINESNRRVLSKSVQFNNEDVNIDLSRFPPGAYQVIINTGESQISRKIYKY
jgi:hypothetical protein